LACQQAGAGCRLIEMGRDLELEQTNCAVCGSDDAKTVATGQDYLHRTSGQKYTFVGCNGCGHIYLNPRPKLSEIGILYPAEYATFTKRFAQSDALSKVKDRVRMSRFRSFADKLPNLEKARILDVGCGDTGFLAAIRRSLPDAELSGLDWHFGPEVEEGAHRARIETITGAIEEVDLPADQFDVITMNQLIEHVWDVDLVMQRCFRALKPGGLLAIETPNPDGWDRTFFKSGGWGGYYWPRQPVHGAEPVKGRGARRLQCRDDREPLGAAVLDLLGAVLRASNGRRLDREGHPRQQRHLPRRLRSY
jgi:SAM-dependent methyltransferase